MEIGIAEMPVFDKNKEDGGYQYPPCSRYNCGHHWPSLQRTLAEGPLPLRASVDIGAVVGNDSPKDVPILIHGTCDCVVLHGKWNFAGVINGMDLQMKRTSWYTQVGPVSSHESSRRRKLKHEGNLGLKGGFL